MGVGTIRLLSHILCLHDMFAFTLMDIIYLRNVIGISFHTQRVRGWSNTESDLNKRKYLLFMADCHQIWA